MKDMKGYAFNVGCTVARAVMYGKSPMIDLCTVTRIENGKVYLDESKQPMKFPERLLIVEQDKLYRMLKQHDETTEDENG
jgi:hypothetical protein